METNGTNSVLECNGDAPSIRCSNGVPETKPAAEGRTPKGRFAKGNKIARGNPVARRMHEFRVALLATLDRLKFASLGKKLFEAAMKGDWVAAKLLLHYAIGKPREAPDPDRLDLQEWVLLNSGPTKPEVVAALMDTCNPAQAAELVQAAMMCTGREAFAESLKNVVGGGGVRLTAEIEARTARTKRKKRDFATEQRRASRGK